MKTSKERILISGSTGFIASNIQSCNSLTEWYEFLPLKRKSQYDTNSNCHCNNRYYCSCKEYKNIAYCIHLGGASVSRPFYSSEYKHTLRDSHVITTRELLYTLAPKMPTLKRVFIASAASIYGDQGDKLLTEDNEILPSQSQNMLNSLLIEKEESCKEYNAPYTILRLGIVFGNQELEKKLKLFEYFRVSDGEQYISTIYIKHLLLAVESLLKKEVNGVVNVVDNNAKFNERFKGKIRLPIESFIADSSILQNLIISNRVKSKILHNRYPDVF
jgi:NAD dependent epimerase/dehydratase family enzyme